MSSSPFAPRSAQPTQPVQSVQPMQVGQVSSQGFNPYVGVSDYYGVEQAQQSQYQYQQSGFCQSSYAGCDSVQQSRVFQQGQSSVPKGRGKGLLVAMLVLAILGVSAGIIAVVLFLHHDNSGKVRARDHLVEVPAEQVFQGIELAWKNPVQVSFSHIAPLHVSASEPDPESRHVMVIGWNDTQAEVVVIDSSTRKTVDIADTSVNVADLGGQVTQKGTLLVDLPQDSPSGVVPIDVYADGKSGAEPAIVMAGVTEDVDVPSVEDFAVPAGLTYRTLIVGVDESGDERAVAAASDMNNPASCKIVAYSLDGTAQWVEDLDVSCDQVSANNHGTIHVVMLDEASGSVTIQEYAPSAEPAPVPTEADLPATIPADYIKTLDFNNLPARSGGDNCVATEGAPTLDNITLINSFAKMPNPGDIRDDCWWEMKDGQAQTWDPRYERAGLGFVPIFATRNGTGERFPTYYDDYNGDGFLDANVKGLTDEGGMGAFYIFDPADPQHPWGALEPIQWGY